MRYKRFGVTDASTRSPSPPAPTPSRRHRSGSGVILVIGALFLLIMALMGLSQSFFASQVSDIASRATLGRVAQLAAESTMEEARGLVAAHANATSDRIFSMLRPHPLPTRWTDLGGIDLQLSDLPQAAQAFATAPLNEFELVSGVHVEFYFQRRTNIAVGNDVEETAEFHARVRFKKEHSVVRDVTETIALRTSRMTFLAPIPKVAMIARRPVQMCLGTARGDNPTDCGLAGVCVNRFVRDILDNQIKNDRQNIQNTINDPNLNKSDDPMPRILAMFKRLLNDPADGGMNHVKMVEDYKARLIPPYPSPVPASPTKALLVGPGPSLDLDRINLQRTMNKYAVMLSQNFTDVQNANATVKARTQSNDVPGTVAAYQTYTDLLLKRLRIMFTVLHYVRDFQLVANQVLGTGSSAQTYRSLTYLTGLVEPRQLARSWSVAAQSATLVVAEDPPGPDHRAISDKIKDLLARIDPAGTGVNAIINVMNSQETLTLQGPYTGKLMFYVSGPCVIDNAQSKGQDDTLTIVALGRGGNREVAVKGTIKACLALDSASAIFPPQGVVIDGTLIMDDLPATRLEDFHGKIDVDARLASVQEDHVTYVTVSPWIRSLVVGRK